MRYCAPATTFRMPGLQFGLVLGTARLARLVGAGAAQRLLATSATFDADHAQRIGFIDAVAAPEQWEQAAAAQAERASFLPPQSRELLYRTLDDECADADLATLVRSAARPGIKSRIAAYRAAAPSATRPS
jgi:enoyl-CoA hydratase/carnithine racemase